MDTFNLHDARSPSSAFSQSFHQQMDKHILRQTLLQVKKQKGLLVK